MSVTSETKPLTIPKLVGKKAKKEKIVTLTAYDFTTAQIIDKAGVDIILVGDSLAMTVLGHPNTLSVTVDEMLHHCQAVSRGTEKAVVIGDMPFMSYTGDINVAITNAGRFIKEAQCHGVKVEGASKPVLKLIKRLTTMGIPVMGHLGLTPQFINTIGGFKVQGKTLDHAKQLLKDAEKLQEAGVFSLVLEMVPVELSTLISESLEVPTIGIGSGNGCDGQVLVIDDILGRYQAFTPKFVRTYMNSAQLITQAVQQYRQDIETGSFPDNEKEAFGYPEPSELPKLHEKFLDHNPVKPEVIESELALHVS